MFWTQTYESTRVAVRLHTYTHTYMYFAYGTYKKWRPLLSFLACFTGKTGELKERSFCQALVTKLEKIRCTYFGHKAFHRCWRLQHFLQHYNIHYNIHCVDYFPCYLGCNLWLYCTITIHVPCTSYLRTHLSAVRSLQKVVALKT